MTTPLPDPLVPAEVDLRGFEFMPLHGEALFKSKTWIGAKAEAKIAMLKIWWQAFSHEVPAASIPQNDQLLADYAGFGVAVSSWKRVRPVVLRGFIECSDGRLYHPFLAKVVMSSWRARLADRLRGIKGRIGSTEKKLRDESDSTTKASLQRLLHGQQQELSQLTEWSVTAHTWRLSQTSKGSEEKGSEAKRGEGSSSSKPPQQQSPSVGSGLSTAHDGNGAAAAASALIFPEKLSSSDAGAAAALLVDIDNPQVILDELEGVITSTAGCRNPMGLLKDLIAQKRRGEFIPSHAHRIEAEREHRQVVREVQRQQA